ncbi:coiled-coil domain-containing protein 103-like [Asterias rubens]|uniref:coiled-coil domain-containing protein 103-like n=1 Tax=Asterias rubens TaxID=7604 RepID=UPI001455880B|nr:coiled-coil domain-containing protein 103-like [Asterias rubens]XP_033629033.1 coiled-coil domain-containing protein 103-like [Asterias rubens]
MANLKEDWIDFSKLEQELSQAVEKDARYWRENDAKMRAVGQKVESYEQFRDMVAAAHIKPLEKEDKIGQGKRNQPWNPYTSKSTTHDSSESSKSCDISSKTPDKLPKSSTAFTRDWKQIYKTTSEKYNLLKCIGSEGLALIFLNEISCGLLGEILTIMNEEFQANDLHCVVDIMWSLTETKRFGLNLDFLSKIEREKLGELFQKLADLEDGSQLTNSKDETENSGDGFKDKLSRVKELYKI